MNKRIENKIIITIMSKILPHFCQSIPGLAPSTRSMS